MKTTMMVLSLKTNKGPTKEVTTMRQTMMTLTLLLAAAALIAAFSSPATAAVTGYCGNCHTMHNSQGGAPMAYDASGNTTATPNAHLAISSCLGCHSVNVGAVVGPKVDGDYGTATARAGGTFKYDGAGTTGPADDNSVHNVHSADVPIPATLTEDGTFTTTIPGLTTGMNADKGSTDPQDLTCAGQEGCHGDATVAGNDAGIGGFHHGTKEGYRFLQIATDQSAVSGLGSSDWEEGGATDANHNVYSSDTSVGISKLCGNCHPVFHGLGNTQSGSDWIRHPTDQNLKAGWSPNTTSPDLYEEHPFAFASLTGKSTTAAYDETSAQVMCLSCHRAHGTPYGDLLRWDYDTQNAGSGFDEGCLGCHSDQR